MAGASERCTHVATIAPLAATLPITHRSSRSAADQHSRALAANRIGMWFSGGSWTCCESLAVASAMINCID